MLINMVRGNSVKWKVAAQIGSWNFIELIP